MAGLGQGVSFNQMLARNLVYESLSLVRLVWGRVAGLGQGVSFNQMLARNWVYESLSLVR